MTISVAIADDQALVRMGLRVLIESEDDLVLAGEAEDGRQAVELVRRSQPDVILIDIRMPELDGIAALRMIVGDASPSHPETDRGLCSTPPRTSTRRH